MAKHRAKKKHPSHPANNRRGDASTWDRVTLWLRQNEKLLMTVLLILLAPSFAFIGPISGFFSGGSGRTATQIYGEDISESEYMLLSGKLRIVDALLADPRFGYPDRLLKGSELLGDPEINVSYFLAYKKKAHDFGIRVSDVELTDRIRQCWRDIKSFEDAYLELQATQTDPAAQRYLGFQAGSLAQEKAKELAAAGVFDAPDWARRVVRLGRRLGITVRPRDVEDTLRDYLAVEKLEEYLVSNVQVTPAEVFEHYRTLDQKRELSWVEVRPSDELLASLEASAGDEAALSEYFETRIAAARDARREGRRDVYNPFDREFALRARCLIVPLDHFRVAAVQSVTPEDLEKYYADKRNDFRRPVIRRDEACPLVSV